MYVDGESKGNPANHEGSRAFPLAASHTWNSLPEDVTSASTLRSFKQRLKTHLFRQSFAELYFSGPCNDIVIYATLNSF